MASPSLQTLHLMMPSVQCLQAPLLSTTAGPATVKYFTRRVPRVVKTLHPDGRMLHLMALPYSVGSSSLIGSQEGITKSATVAGFFNQSFGCLTSTSICNKQKVGCTSAAALRIRMEKRAIQRGIELQQQVLCSFETEVDPFLCSKLTTKSIFLVSPRTTDLNNKLLP